MMMASDPSESTLCVVATEHLDPDGSVVKSGIALADVALRTLEQDGTVRISLKGLKGASSSYFNVFLRRIEEGCGLAEIGRRIKLEFGSNVQETVFQRSFDSRGPRAPSGQNVASPLAASDHGPTVWKRILRVFGAGSAR